MATRIQFRAGFPKRVLVAFTDSDRKNSRSLFMRRVPRVFKVVIPVLGGYVELEVLAVLGTINGGGDRGGSLEFGCGYVIEGAAAAAE